jgi:lysine decarboxylase
MFADLKSAFGHDMLEFDVPMLTDGVDYGKAPTPLELSRQLAADAWGAKRTWFLTNGASQGNLLACLALGNLGDTIVLQRSMHSSIIDGLAFSGLSAEYVMPSVDPYLGVPNGVTPEQLRDSLAKATSSGAKVAAAYVVSPSYLGTVADIAALAEVAHSFGIPLVVDEAWGPHFGFTESLPTNAVRLGADMAVSSTHKLGGSLSQSAMFHLGKSDFANALEPLIDRAFRSLQSTSVNSHLIASLDLARKGLMVQGPKLIPKSIAAMNQLRNRLGNRFPDATPRLLAFPDVITTDPLRVVVDTLTGGVPGYEARSILFKEHGVHCEMATHSSIVMLTGAGVCPDVERIVKAFESLPVLESAQSEAAALELPTPGEKVLRVREAYFSPTEIVSAEQAVGRISADSLAAYPPGIPNLLPGELITKAAIDFLQATIAAPYGHVRGGASPAMDAFRVVKN